MKCRVCQTSNLETVMDLGLLPISDFPAMPNNIATAPLEVVLCPNCHLVQLKHTVSRDSLYKGKYWYRSGTNESMILALKDVVNEVCKWVELKPGDCVLDIGSNDGTLLSFYPDTVTIHGFEPYPSLAFESMELLGRGNIFPTYFPDKNLNCRYKIITSIAQFYNVDDLVSYVKAIKDILHPDGVWCVQMGYLKTILLTNDIGNFCHEHLTFWTLSPLQYLLKRFGLGIVNLEFNQVNGGSFRVMVKHGKGSTFHDTITKEDFKEFSSKLKGLKEETLSLLKSCGGLIIGLGASTKNNIVLSYYGIGPELIPYFAERQPEKWGRYTVTGIPIISEEEARNLKPDYYFVGPFHFIESLKNRERAFLEAGGKFIVPFPNLHLIGG